MRAARVARTAIAWLATLAVTGSVVNGQRPPATTSTAPVIVVETTKGTFSIETFPKDAPVTVAHIVELAKNHFYDGQRVHRAIPGFVVQFGDPQSRDNSKRAIWGRGAAAASGTPIGVAEISQTRLHVEGAVGVSHMGDPRKADSQIYVALRKRPDLDGQYAVFGQVMQGLEVLSMLDVGDVIVKVSVKP
jgi:cyclophilin family peptidyl-prolyl cis-trans isomerase